MAAENALKVVRQIQGLADGPKTDQMRECLGHVVSSLQFFLDHPDSRVRGSSAKAMARLATTYTDDIRRLDLSKTKAAYRKCCSAADAGAAEQDVLELRALLAEVLVAAGVEAAAVPAEVVASAEQKVDGRGEVVLRVGERCENRASILEAVVKVPGVVSVTLEGDHVVVNTRTRALATDSAFMFDLLKAVREQANGQKVEVVRGAAPGQGGGAAPGQSGVDDTEPQSAKVDAPTADDTEPQYLDDDDEDEVVLSMESPGATAGSPFAPGMGMGGLGGMGMGGMGGMGGTPGGLGALGGAPGQPQWSFFSQNTWMTGRRVQEFQDDPAIAARLARVKEREDARKAEEQSRLSKITSWFAGRG